MPLKGKNFIIFVHKHKKAIISSSIYIQEEPTQAFTSWKVAPVFKLGDFVLLSIVLTYIFVLDYQDVIGIH